MWNIPLNCPSYGIFHTFAHYYGIFMEYSRFKNAPANTHVPHVWNDPIPVIGRDEPLAQQEQLLEDLHKL